MNFVDNYFCTFLEGKKNSPLVEGYDSYSVLFSIYFKDLGKYWKVKVTNGCIEDIRTVAEPEGKVQFIVTSDVFEQIVALKLSPQKAFFTRKTNIKGNLFEGLKLAKILELFFTSHPLPCEMKIK